MSQEWSDLGALHTLQRVFTGSLALRANLEWTYSNLHFGPSVFILENLENLTGMTHSQGKWRILPLFSQNEFYIREQSEHQPGSDQGPRAGRKPSCVKLRVNRKEEKNGSAIKRCGVTVGKGHLGMSEMRILFVSHNLPLSDRTHQAPGHVFKDLTSFYLQNDFNCWDNRACCRSCRFVHRWTLECTWCTCLWIYLLHVSCL